MGKVSIVGELTLDGSGWDRTLKTAEKGAEHLKDSTLELGRAMGVAFTVGGVIEAGRRTLEFAENMKNGAARLNISTQAMQEFNFAAQQTGTDLGAVEGAMDRLAKAKEVSQGFGGASPAEMDELNEAFGQLGISLEDVKTKSPEEMFRMVGERIEELGTNAKTTTAAMEIFGRGAGALIPMLKELREKSGEAPLVSEEDLDRLQILNQSLKEQQADIMVWSAKLATHPLRTLFGFTGFGKSEDRHESEEAAEMKRRMADQNDTLAFHQMMRARVTGTAVGPHSMSAKEQDTQDKEIARLNADTSKTKTESAEKHLSLEERITAEEKEQVELAEALKKAKDPLTIADLKNQQAHNNEALGKDRAKHLDSQLEILKKDHPLHNLQGDSLTKTGNFLGTSSSSIVAIGEKTNAILQSILTVLTAGGGHGGHPAGGTHGVPPVP